MRSLVPSKDRKYHHTVPCIYTLDLVNSILVPKISSAVSVLYVHIWLCL